MAGQPRPATPVRRPRPRGQVPGNSDDDVRPPAVLTRPPSSCSAAAMDGVSTTAPIPARLPGRRASPRSATSAFDDVELEVDPAHRRSTDGGDGDSSLPIWLRGDSHAPSRQGSEVGVVDDALFGLECSRSNDDHRKTKRLQSEVQRLTERLKEASGCNSSDGLPAFTLDEVELGDQIAQGGFAIVHRARWRCTPCAVKKIFDPVITAELREDFDNEVRMLSRLRHPNVVTMMAICRQPPALSVIFELMGGPSFFEMLHSVGRPRDTELAVTLPIVGQVALALGFLHASLVVHRDIKPHNVLLSVACPPVAKICDFGIARMKSEICTGTMQWAGTPPYMAPELFAKVRYSEAVDVFAFGVLLWEALAVDLPHANLEAHDIIEKVKRDGASLAVDHAWPRLLRELLRRLLAVSADQRPSMEEASRVIAQIEAELFKADQA
eukprot:NODE_6396_length_1675_cov_15.799096.p1 GENE.NODE_6396_length_1675_cov_15.799096~~NODE_6396_length_1675_cov_15.799096.p1  ORF type:complete len:439 (+),score=89.36 NODE_6396_length_1675_cov_15.799096:135-1451(+)